MKMKFVRLKWVQGGTRRWITQPLKDSKGMAINRKTGEYIRSEIDGCYLFVDPNVLQVVFETELGEKCKVDITDMVYNSFKKRKNITIKVRNELEEEFTKSNFELVYNNTQQETPIAKLESFRNIGRKVIVKGLYEAVQRTVRKIDP